MQSVESSKSSSSTRMPPGPTRGLRSTLRATQQLIAQPLETLAQWQKEYGNTFTVNRVALPTLFMTGDPDLVGQIYAVRDNGEFEAVVHQAADVLFGAHSLMLISGARHQRERCGHAGRHSSKGFHTTTRSIVHSHRCAPTKLRSGGSRHALLRLGRTSGLRVDSCKKSACQRVSHLNYLTK